jgi:hypothetical protein
MIRWLMKKGVATFERRWHYDAAYLRAMIDASPRAAWLFMRATRLATYRRVPLDAWSAAAIVAVRQEDCGPCTQLAVDMAAHEGVDPEVLRAVLTENRDAMPHGVALAWAFARASLAHNPSADELRAEIVERWGEEGVVSLAFAMLTARMYPTVKYAMGHGKACTRIQVGGTPVVFGQVVASGHRA